MRLFEVKHEVKHLHPIKRGWGAEISDTLKCNRCPKCVFMRAKLEEK